MKRNLSSLCNYNIAKRYLLQFGQLIRKWEDFQRQYRKWKSRINGSGNRKLCSWEFYRWGISRSSVLIMACDWLIGSDTCVVLTIKLVVEEQASSWRNITFNRWLFSLFSTKNNHSWKDINWYMLRSMTMDPKTGWSQPEQRGPAQKLWGKIMETNNSLGSPTTLGSNTELVKRSSDFIPLIPRNGVDSTFVKNIINNDKTFGGKRKRSENIASTSNMDVSSSEETVPWRPKEKNYANGTVG